MWGKSGVRNKNHIPSNQPTKPSMTSQGTEFALLFGFSFPFNFQFFLSALPLHNAKIAIQPPVSQQAHPNRRHSCLYNNDNDHHHPPPLSCSWHISTKSKAVKWLNEQISVSDPAQNCSGCYYFIIQRRSQQSIIAANQSNRSSRRPINLAITRSLSVKC